MDAAPDRGRPLSFAPLAGLGDVADDPDEFEIALDNAVASLVPRTGLPASGARLSRGRAVLKEALCAYVRCGGGDLKGFLGYLSALPEGVSRLASGAQLAAEIAQTLLAETVNDPMLGGAGEPVDPSVLLQPAGGRRARISVISLVGLPNDKQRQHFVNQLQMALFAWVRKHPAGGRPLGGLLVMDEAQTFAPAAGRTATTGSTLALASQARKYGSPDLRHAGAEGTAQPDPGNATTQFFGLLNAPAQIAAAQEMAAQKGGDARGIARLRPGQFFAASDAVAFQGVRSPMCLSHHPRSPPDPGRDPGAGSRAVTRATMPRSGYTGSLLERHRGPDSCRSHHRERNRSNFRIRCDALVDTGAAYLTLPNVWRDRLGTLTTLDTVAVETANQSVVSGDICGPVLLRMEHFRPVLTEVLFIEMDPADGQYEPLIGYIPLEQAQAVVDLAGHRLVKVGRVDLK